MPAVLYSFRRCPYAMRARMAIASSGLDPEHREILLSDRPDELHAASPKATVPVVVLEDGSVLEESLNVMRWALAHHDPQAWLPASEADKRDCERLIASNDGPFKENLDRFKYDTRYEDGDPIAARERAEVFVDELESRLRARNNLLRDTISFADVAIFPFVRQFARADAPWFESTGYSNVRRWLAAWEERPVFRAVMGKLEPWRRGDPPLRFRQAFDTSRL